jgi:hypothetical protein
LARSKLTHLASITQALKHEIDKPIDQPPERLPENLAMWVLVKNCCSYGGILNSSGLKGDVSGGCLTQSCEHCVAFTTVVQGACLTMGSAHSRKLSLSTRSFGSPSEFIALQ